MYVHKSKRVVLLSYVDDCYLVGDTERVTACLNTIKKEYSLRDLGMPADILGLQLRRTPDYLELTCSKFAGSLLQRFNLPAATVTTPMLPHTTLTANDSADTKPDSRLYRQYVGCINFAASRVRPDCAHAAHQLSRHLNNPSHAHMRQAIRTLQYLHCTRDLGLRFRTDHAHACCANPH